jgi:hypothetical protein
MTASVHYLRFGLSPSQVARLADGPVSLVATHPEYGHETLLSDETRGELLADLSG